MLGLVAVLGLLSGAARAADCVTADMTIQALSSRPEIKVQHHLTGAVAERFGALYNAIPPQSDFSVDEVLVFVAPGYVPTAMIVLYDHGCYVTRDTNFLVEQVERMVVEAENAEPAD